MARRRHLPLAQKVTGHPHNGPAGDDVPYLSLLKVLLAQKLAEEMAEKGSVGKA
jgi:hypothetical protein